MLSERNILHVFFTFSKKLNKNVRESKIKKNEKRNKNNFKFNKWFLDRGVNKVG